MSKETTLYDYASFLKEIKTRIRQAQVIAAWAVNSELVRLYWDIGRMIDERQHREGWGATVIPRLAKELKNELPELKGFSERNIKRMLAFHREYPNPEEFGQQPVAQLVAAEKVPQAAAQLETIGKVPQPAAQITKSPLRSIPWFHHVILMEKVKDHPARRWYMDQTIANGWSRNVLSLMIQNRAHERQGKAITNFELKLPSVQSDLVKQTLKDPYIFDFLTLEQPFHERELETSLVRHLEKFLLELGAGFAFVGRQVHLEVGDEDFYIDLLFYHLKLRCFVVIELKTGPFKADYAGKMNFYLNVVDDRLKHPSDQPSIGLILCQEKNRILAEYALRGMTKAIGVSEYQLTRSLPKEFKSILPSVEEIEAELAKMKKIPRSIRKTRKDK